MTRISQLKEYLNDTPEKLFLNMEMNFGEITLTVSDKNYLSLMRFLRDDEKFSFDVLIDLCGVDYLSYENNPNKGKRYAVVVHLLSTIKNWRIRVRVFAENNEEPKLPSVFEIWNCAGWFEREAFDLFGIYFELHPDLRRILTDYEFDGHPFRKDFPIQGYVEMRYDEKEGRVAYKPVSIDARETVPRIVRERRV